MANKLLQQAENKRSQLNSGITWKKKVEKPILKTTENRIKMT